MNFELFGFDFMPKERLFGFWIASVKGNNIHRHLFGVCFADGELLIDICFLRVVTYP